jgi:hypothetical protein
MAIAIAALFLPPNGLMAFKRMLIDDETVITEQWFDLIFQTLAFSLWFKSTFNDR